MPVDVNAVRIVFERTVPEKSIVALPFADMSADGDHEYFGDGIAEEILNLLAQIPSKSRCRSLLSHGVQRKQTRKPTNAFCRDGLSIIDVVKAI